MSDHAPSTGQSIAHNASVLMASQLVTWGLSLLLLVFLPRALGPEAMGKFHLANAIWGIMAIVVTFGMDLLLTREIARDPEQTGALFGTSLVLRTVLYGLSFGVVLVYARGVGYSAETIAVIIVIGLANCLWNFINICRAVLQGLERMTFISVANIASTAFNTIVVLLLLWLGYGVVVIAAVAIGAALINFVIQYRALRRVRAFRLRYDAALARRLLRTSVPFFLSTIFLTLYQQIDAIIISLLVDETTLGWYGTADQLFGTLLFVPSVFMTAVFPVLSRMYASADDNLPRLISKSFNLLLLLSVPIGLGIAAIANPLVVLLFSDQFAGSGPVLAVLGVVLLLTYQNMLLWQFYMSSDRQRLWTVVIGVALLATLPLDLVLIPWCRATFGNGAIGGALAFVVTESIMLVVGLRWLPAGALTRANAGFAARTLLAGGLMALAVWPVRDWFLAVPLLVGVVTYGALVLGLRIVPSEDWAALRGAGLALWDKVRRRNQPIVEAPA